MWRATTKETMKRLFAEVFAGAIFLSLLYMVAWAVLWAATTIGALNCEVSNSSIVAVMVLLLACEIFVAGKPLRPSSEY